MREPDGKDDTRHREVHQHFVPWATRLLDGQRVNRPRGGVRLQPGDSSTLTAEARDHLARCLPVTVMRFLTYHGGWRPVSVPLSGDKIDRRARLSAEHIWDDYELEFTHRSLDALLWAYWRGMRVSRDVVPHRSWTNGDLLMKHLIRQRMTEDFRRSGRMLSGDPLSAICGMPGLQLDEGHPSLVFELLEPVLPWLSRRVADRWVFGIRAFVARYSSGGHERVEVIETAIEGWHETAVERERYDLLRPLIAAGASLGEWLASDPSPVEVFYEDLSAWSFSARMGVADTLATALRALAVARETYDECRALPHFDRRADQRIFMQECEEQGMSTHWERLDGAIALLERRIR